MWERTHCSAGECVRGVRPECVVRLCPTGAVQSINQSGGPQLHTASLPPELFQAGGDGELEQDLMAMQVVEVRAALEARGEAVSGNKAWLRRRLHTAVVRMYLAAAEADHGI